MVPIEIVTQIKEANQMILVRVLHLRMNLDHWLTQATVIEVNISVIMIA